tara:strand:+ start:45 stop:407 length:363 start_codon:yes stop_codon:yes gene_type:complete
MTSKETIKKIVDLYVERSILQERLDLAKVDKKSMEDLEKQILELLPEIIPLVDQTENFIKILQELIVENSEQFEIAFTEPFLDDFINILLFDMKKKKIIDKHKLDSLKKKYSEQKIEINI